MSKSVPIQGQKSVPIQGQQQTAAPPQGGVRLDLSKSVPITQPTALQNAGQAALGFGKGIVEGAGQTGNSIVHATDYLGNKIGDAIGLPGHASVQDMAGTGPAGQGSAIMENLTTPTTTSEKVGVGAESIAEFIGGDEALKGLSLGEKALKAAKLADAYEKAGPLAKAAITAVMNAGRSGVVGAAQGMAHGENTKEAAEQGALTSVISLGGSATSALLKGVVDRMADPKVTQYATGIATDYLRKAVAAGGQGIPEGLKDWLVNTGKDELQSPEGVQKTVELISKTPAAFNQFVTDIAKHVPSVAAKSLIGYAVYKSGLPDVIKESVITGLGLHEMGSLTALAGSPEASMLAGRAAQVAQPFVAPTTSLVQGTAAAMQPVKPTPQQEPKQ